MEQQSLFDKLGSIPDEQIFTKEFLQRIKEEAEAEPVGEVKPQPMIIPSDYTAEEFVEALGEEEAKKLHLI